MFFKIIVSQYQGVAPGILNKVHQVEILWIIGLLILRRLSLHLASCGIPCDFLLQLRKKLQHTQHLKRESVKVYRSPQYYHVDNFARDHPSFGQARPENRPSI